MTETKTDLTDVLAYITQDASADDLQRVATTSTSRRRTLAAITAARVSEGARVRLSNLTPKYLNGLTGVVESIAGQRGSVRLDESSTDALRYAGKRFYVGPGTTQYLLTGVPLSCCLID